MIFKKGLITLTVMVALAAFVSTGWCFNSKAVIGKGTKSLCGDLDMSFAKLKTDEKKIANADSDTDSFGINAGAGYFVIDNLELGLSVSYSSSKADSDDDSSNEQMIMNIGPFIYYHLPITENLFLIFGGGFGYSQYNDKYNIKGTDEFGPYEQDEEKDGGGLFYGINLGVEHFVTDSVSIIGALTYLKLDIDGDIKTLKDWETPPRQKSKFDESNTKTGMTVGIRLYF